jgi:hypothetical protein
MKNNLDIKKEKIKLQESVQKWFSLLKSHIDIVPENLNEQVQTLNKIRIDNYEELNQLQHVAAIIIVAEKLQLEFPEINKWAWHPRQTSHKNFADLTGFVNDNVILNAEVTTSMKPIGTIDKRMQNTLTSLSNKTGRKFYFVQTDVMLRRAKTKISKNNNWDIEIRRI